MRKLFVLALALSACATEDDVDDDTPLEVTDDDMAADDDFADSVGDGKEDSALSYVAVARLVKTAGVACTGERIATAVAVAKAESGFRPQITNTVGNTHGIDRGLFQINSYWHPEVSATCALSASCNTRAAVRIKQEGDAVERVVDVEERQAQAVHAVGAQRASDCLRRVEVVVDRRHSAR